MLSSEHSFVKTAAFCGVLAIASFSTSSYATVVQCGDAVCAVPFTIDFNGQSSVGGGELLYDAESGDISFNTANESITGNGMFNESNGSLMWTMMEGTLNETRFSVNSLGGNADPIISFGLGASTGNLGGTFAFNFSLPIALEGPIAASSSVSYTLTSETSAGAKIAPLNGKVVTALEVDTSVNGIGTLNKGVDVGEIFEFTGGPIVQNSSVYSATNNFNGDLAYDLMSVTIAFSLSAESAVGLSGFVNQTPVPIPAAVWFLLSGMLGIFTISRREVS